MFDLWYRWLKADAASEQGRNQPGRLRPSAASGPGMTLPETLSSCDYLVDGPRGRSCVPRSASQNVVSDELVQVSHIGVALELKLDPSQP